MQDLKKMLVGIPQVDSKLATIFPINHLLKKRFRWFVKTFIKKQANMYQVIKEGYFLYWGALGHDYMWLLIPKKTIDE